MQGGFQSEQDRVEILNAQIADLERRKKTLSDEIEAHYRAYKNRLDLEYNEKVNKIEDEHIKRQTSLDKREEAIAKRESFIENKITSVSSEIDAKLKESQKKIDEAEKLKDSYLQLKEKIEEEYAKKVAVLESKEKVLETERESLAKEKKIALDIQSSASQLEAKNKETRDRLAVEVKAVEGERAYNTYISDENKKKEIELSYAKEISDKRDADLNARERGVVKLEEEADKKMDQANMILSEAKTQKEALDVKEEKLKVQGEEFAKWRDDLNEQHLTLKEKDRFLVIKEREIDTKINILKKLRESQEV
jgi:hypothetical protein